MINYRLCVSGPGAGRGWLIVPGPSFWRTSYQNSRLRRRWERGCCHLNLSGVRESVGSFKTRELSAGKIEGFGGGLPGIKMQWKCSLCAEICHQIASPLNGIKCHGRQPLSCTLPIFHIRIISGNRWSAVDTRILTPANIKGSFVHILIAKEA